MEKRTGKFALRCAVATVSGLMVAASFAPLGWRWLILPGLILFLISLQGQQGARARCLGWLHGYAAFAVGLSWVWNLFGPLALVLWAVLAFFPMAFAHFQGRAFARGWAGWKWVVFTTLNWGAWEFIRAEIFPLKFPWMTLGLALGPHSLLPWVGVYGVGLVVIFAAATAVLKMGKPTVAAWVVLVGGIVLMRPHAPLSEGDAGVVEVAGVQLEGVTIDDYIKATGALPDGIQHVVWPEYAVPYDIRRDARDTALLQRLCEEKGITLTFGSKAMRDDGSAWRNVAITMDASGFVGEHTKMHTVHFFDDGKPGEEAGVIAAKPAVFGSPICFDCDYEGVSRRMVRKGAEYVVVPTMDAASWSARQHDQHAELARMRAAESGRWFFVVATSGVSQIIDPSGHLHARLGALEQGVIQGRVKRETAITFHTRIGWLIPWCVLGLTVPAWIFLMLPYRKAVA